MPSEDTGTEIDRRCTNCGKAVDELPYQFWLFHTCRSCAVETTTRRAGLRSERKWRYFPRWHHTQHPDLPDRVRARQGVMG